MRRSVLLVLLVLVGCAAIAAAPISGPSLSGTMQEGMTFYPVPVKLHDVIIASGGKTTTQFLLRPNVYQTCACTVEAEFVVCACISPEVGLCPETSI